MPRSKGHDITAHRTQAGRLRHLEKEYTEAETVTDVEEVWFAGCHCGTFCHFIFDAVSRDTAYYTYVKIMRT
jgi:hypothetical protein